MESETSIQKKKIVIKIQGTATYSDKSELDQVKAFDDFISDLFKKYQDTLQREFEAAGELSYEEGDEKTDEMIDPYLKDFNFDIVTKDVR